MRTAAALAVALVLVAARGAAAQEARLPPEPRPPDPAGTFSFVLENDTFAGTDRFYTNGFLFAWQAPSYDPPGWMARLTERSRLFPDGGVTRWGLAFGQSKFTPEDIERRDPDPADRPYAGWLYVAASLSSYTATAFSNAEVQVGVVGPSALGRQVQNGTHDLLGIDRAYGWDAQIRDEPGVNLVHNRAWRHNWETGRGDLRVGVVPSLTFSLGNVFTYAGAGLTLRVGNELMADFGPPRIRPASSGTAFFQPDGDWGWYAFVGVEGRAVGRDVTLDGNTWRSSRSVDREVLVADASAGAVLLLPRARLTASYTVRTHEFETQREAAHFGSLSLSVRF